MKDITLTNKDKFVVVQWSKEEKPTMYCGQNGLEHNSDLYMAIYAILDLAIGADIKYLTEDGHTMVEVKGFVNDMMDGLVEKAFDEHISKEGDMEVENDCE